MLCLFRFWSWRINNKNPEQAAQAIRTRGIEAVKVAEETRLQTQRRTEAARSPDRRRRKLIFYCDLCPDAFAIVGRRSFFQR